MAHKDALDFVMGFVSTSEKWKGQFTEKWQEVVSNFIVEPYQHAGGDSVNPYRNKNSSYGLRDEIILKDAETHKIVMTYASKLTQALFGNRDREYIQARPVGYEDALGKSQTVTRLLRYSFGLQGHFRTFVESITDMLLFGTGIIEVGWKYEEREMPVRQVDTSEGYERSYFTRMRIPTYNDVTIRNVDPMDFYPDPSEYRIHEMSGVAKRFKMTAMRAKAMGESGIYDKEAVRKAIRDAPTGSFKKPTTLAQDVRGDQPQDREVVSSFKEMIGFEYYGEVPWADEFGSSRRVITVLNGHVVRDRPYPFSDPCLPFHTMIINPVTGRFYGISPGEVIRYDQSFADALKMLTAEAVVRAVHPPIAYDPDADIDLNKVMRWRADNPIGIRGGPKSIGTLNYDADFGAAFNTQLQLTDSMQGGSGAPGGIQGEPGPNREAATVGAMRLQAALDRPELAAMVVENECLPSIGLSILRRNQQFLQDSSALALRIGEKPESVWIGDILGEFDIQFVGSRLSASKQEKLQAYDRLGAMSAALPQFGMQVPWMLIGQDIVGKQLDLPEVAAMMGDPQTIMQNLQMAQQAGNQGGSGSNGTQPRSEPAGLAPAQATGNVVAD